MSTSTVIIPAVLAVHAEMQPPAIHFTEYAQNESMSDIGLTQHGLELFGCHAVTASCRDTKNHTMLAHDRNLGGQVTTNTLAFRPPTQFDKPEFARKPLIRYGTRYVDCHS